VDEPCPHDEGEGADLHEQLDAGDAVARAEGHEREGGVVGQRRAEEQRREQLHVSVVREVQVRHRAAEQAERVVEEDVRREGHRVGGVEGSGRARRPRARVGDLERVLHALANLKAESEQEEPRAAKEKGQQRDAGATAVMRKDKVLHAVREHRILLAPRRNGARAVRPRALQDVRPTSRKATDVPADESEDGRPRLGEREPGDGLAGGEQDQRGGEVHYR